jgi:DNA (cytosine-5)-methyltransferase 1
MTIGSHEAAHQASRRHPKALVEGYEIVGRTVVRSTTRGRKLRRQTLPLAPRTPRMPSTAYQVARLQQSDRPKHSGRPVAMVDLFSGCGGLSLGAGEAIAALGHRPTSELALDSNEDALSVFVANISPSSISGDPIERLVDGEFCDRPSRRERSLIRQFDGVDLVVAGPPCQGHSDLNNHTRRSDPRNVLFLRVARFVELTRPAAVLIENVPGVARDRAGVLPTAVSHLRNLGYHVATDVLVATDFGAAQRRRRHVTIARLDGLVPLEETKAALGVRAIAVHDVITDLADRYGDGVFDSSARHSAENRNRIAFLFDHDIYDLPDAERPDCHRLRVHSYKAVYGRMRGNEPSPTITAGFGSTGQGRFVHPHYPRTLTPHEAARVQGFPDWFRFDSCGKRRALQEMIGNAVPAQIGYVATMAALV